MWLAQGEQFAVEEVEVVVATVDLDEVVSWRGKNSSQREQASAAPRWGGSAASLLQIACM
jgi:NAD+ synthase (glutamine-hydrolysing)